MEAMASSSNTSEDEAGWRPETEALLQGPKASPPTTESPYGQMLRYQVACEAGEPGHMEDITPAFARPDTMVNNASNLDVGFESNHRSSDGQKTLGKRSC